MHPELIPASYPDEQLKTLLQGVITRRYKYRNKNYFFTLYPSIAPDIYEFDYIHRYVVVLNCIIGIYTFYIEQNEKGDYVKEQSFEAFDREDPGEIKVQKLIMQVPGVHILNEDPEEVSHEEEIPEYDNDPELTNDPDIEEARLSLHNWLNDGCETLMLSLMNTAIKEYLISR